MAMPDMMSKLWAICLIGVSLLSAQKTPSMHTISVTFDYNFALTPACSATVTQKCVKQFNIYDISAGTTKDKRAQIGSVAVPPNATGFVRGISGKSDPFLFNPGRHRLAVSAQMPDGGESDLRFCTTIVQIP